MEVNAPGKVRSLEGALVGFPTRHFTLAGGRSSSLTLSHFLPFPLSAFPAALASGAGFCRAALGLEALPLEALAFVVLVLLGFARKARSAGLAGRANPDFFALIQNSFVRRLQGFVLGPKTLRCRAGACNR